MQVLTIARINKSVTEPTDCMHPIVVVPKPKSGIRLCVDLQKLNKCVRHQYYLMKTSSAAVSNVPSSFKYFRKLDATKCYCEVPLDKGSQKLTTFVTRFGRFRFLRAPMDLTYSKNECCARSDEAIHGIPNVEKVVDDILVHGDTPQGHPGTVIQGLDRCH